MISYHFDPKLAQQLLLGKAAVRIDWGLFAQHLQALAANYALRTLEMERD